MQSVLVFVLLATALAGGAVACSGPGTAVDDPSSPGAQATSVRRTAVADVQRIIANNPTATALPAPTATPAPTCQGAIWWNEARSHVGEVRTLQGPIVGMRPAPAGTALVEIGQPYPDPSGMVVLLPSAPPTTLTGKTVCVAGRITTAEGRPAVQVRDVSSIVMVN